MSDQAHRRPRVAGLAAALLIGCTGQIAAEPGGAAALGPMSRDPGGAPAGEPGSAGAMTGSGPGAGGSSAASSPGAPGATPPTPDTPAVPSGNNLSTDDLACNGADRGATPARLRRLTKTQYRNSVAVVFNGRPPSAGGAVSTVNEVPSPFGYVSLSDRYSTYAATYTMTDDEFSAVVESAEIAASSLVARLKSDCLGKVTGPADAADCLRKLVAAKGELAFRRPLGDDEVNQYVNLAIANLDTTPGGRDAAFALPFAAMFSSPHFLYRAEVGDGRPDALGRKRLGAYELAAAISYTLSDWPPDVTLWTAAKEGHLATADDVKAQLARYIGSTDKGTAAFLEFMREFMRWDRTPVKDSIANYNLPDTGGLEYPPDDARATVSAWLRNNGRHDIWKTILTSKSFVARGKTAAFWDDAIPRSAGTTVNDIPVTIESRAGMLSIPAFMIDFSTFNRENQPVQRGRFIRASFLCKPVPELPIGTVPPLADLGPNATLRERLKMHTAIPACNACHQFMDPIGLGFEGYSDLGMTRKTDHGKPVDASGALVGAGAVDGPFVGIPELAGKLAQSPDVEQCFVRQNLRYLFGREEVATDGCTVRNVQKAYQAAGGDYVALFTALLSSDSYLYRSGNTLGVTP